eukprot:6485157-Pyramimonas_sp.AAC.1
MTPICTACASGLDHPLGPLARFGPDGATDELRARLEYFRVRGFFDRALQRPSVRPVPPTLR